MSFSPVLPQEIVGQCQRGGSLLIEGGPGSGKTILSLSLLHRLNDLGLKITFISARLPIGTLGRTTPLAEDLSPECLIDASMQRNFEDMPEVPRAPLTDLSDLAMIYLKTAEENGVVALDSWDALLQRDKRPDQEIYTAAVDLIHRTPGSLVFVAESSPNSNPLHHVVDSHVKLDAEVYEGNTLRLLQVEKLRGQEIQTPSYVFTLSDGVFTAYDPRIWNPQERPVRASDLPEPIPERDGYFSTGMTALDRILGGGYKRGSYVGIEIDLEAPSEACDLTYLPTAADFLAKKRPVIVLPPGARDAVSLWETARNILDEGAWSHLKTDLIDEYGRVVSFGSRDEDGPTVEVGSDVQSGLAVWRKEKEELGQKFAQPVLSIVGFDTLTRVYGTEQVIPIIGSTMPETRSRGNLHISIVTSDLDLRKPILGISDYYFRLRMFRGLPVFWGVRPRTTLYTISLANDDGVPKTNLVKIS